MPAGALQLNPYPLGGTSLPLDLTAPILPGIGAAGLRLGEALDRSVAAGAFAVERIARDGVRYSFESVRVSTRYGLTTEIDVAAGYRGTLDGRIGIGSTVGEVNARYGTPAAGEHGSGTRLSRTPGWSFEVTRSTAGEPPTTEGELRVSLIIVFVPPN